MCVRRLPTRECAFYAHWRTFLGRAKPTQPRSIFSPHHVEMNVVLVGERFAVGIRIFIGRSLPHKLLAGLWMLALAEFREVLADTVPVG
jgi:hypothetical protein